MASDQVTHLAHSHIIRNAFGSDEYADVEIQCMGRTWKVHRLMLCGRSEYFKQLWSSAKDSGAKQGSLSHEDPEVMHRVLQYIYTGILNSSPLEGSEEQDWAIPRRGVGPDDYWREYEGGIDDSGDYVPSDDETAYESCDDGLHMVMWTTAKRADGRALEADLGSDHAPAERPFIIESQVEHAFTGDLLVGSPVQEKGFTELTPTQPYEEPSFVPKPFTHQSLVQQQSAGLSLEERPQARKVGLLEQAAPTAHVEKSEALDEEEHEEEYREGLSDVSDPEDADRFSDDSSGGHWSAARQIDGDCSDPAVVLHNDDCERPFYDTIQTRKLITCVKLYAAAVKYKVSGMDKAAAERFASLVDRHFVNDFPDNALYLAREIYLTTPEANRDLRDQIVVLVGERLSDVLERSPRHIVKALAIVPTFGYDLLRAVAGGRI